MTDVKKRVDLLMSLQISQLANETGLSIHTLRYYEKEGIFPPVKRNENGIRIYDQIRLPPSRNGNGYCRYEEIRATCYSGRRI